MRDSHNSSRRLRFVVVGMWWAITDGDIDVVSSGVGCTLQWYENVGGKPASFVTHTIVAPQSVTASVQAADMDNGTCGAQ